jgi:ethanolamine ammonia-lyase small subunit
MSHSPSFIANPWQQLRQLTPARIALGRAGGSLPTQAQLDFQFAHAQARDAVHLPLDCPTLAAEIQALGLECLPLHSAAPNRDTYLQRPDLGRQLDSDSAERLAGRQTAGCDLALIIADGLSALAVQRHALPMLERLQALATQHDWTLGPVCLVEQGRVAIADEIGAALQARMSLILIGERPGLSSPDSLGLYFTWAPKVGLTDANRNCISNVRPQGLSYAMACHRLEYLMGEACRRQLSGVQLKDEAQAPLLHGEHQDGDPRHANFLLAGPDPR